ncbi:MAG: type II toxin-antitoxin system RelE/ParE family toxin [Planctomycetaceae bacterium]|nr:type II toxin-antitoxin system RelE/ParE family toxin [Planctomycetaceae bacterium]
MRKLSLQKTVIKELDELPAKQYRQVVSAILDLLADPVPHYSKRLQNSVYSRIAVGEYRVIYRADDEVVAVATFGKRNDGEVYEWLERHH